MLVVGSQPADYVPLHPADDLARCLRYYEIVGEAQRCLICWVWQLARAGFVPDRIYYKCRARLSLQR